MGIIRKDFNYKLIKNFFTKKELELGRHYFHLLHKRNIKDFDGTLEQSASNNADSVFYSDCFSDAILVQKKKIMEKETGLSLMPTYAFTRFYTYNAELQKHVDRPACEISVSAMWDSDGTKWPLYVDGNPVDMKPGDAVIYLGCESEHWRENFKGDFHLQTFLHYVDKNGPNVEHAYDGVKKPFRLTKMYNPEI